MANKQFGVLLTSDNKCHVDPIKCIICQEDRKGKPPISLPVGRESLKRAANVKNDVVFKRMKIMEQMGVVEFVYHNTNECYKNYTHHKSIEAAAKRHACQLSGVPELEKTTEKVEMQKQAMPLRSSCTPRAPPSSEKDPRDLRCTVCGSESLRVKGTRIYDKCRISTFERAQMFLDATHFFKDEVYDRVPDLEEPGDVLAADIYYHKDCLRKYLLVFERNIKGNKMSRKNPIADQSEMKHQIFTHVMSQIDPLLNRNYGFTVSEIRHLMEEEIGEKPVGSLYNKDIKKMLISHYGDQIQFAKNNRKYESELFFSSSIQGSELASKIKNLDQIREAAEQLRRVILDVDFGLDDRFCDAADLKRSWEETSMPDDWMHFFANLFKIPKAALMKFRLNTIFPKSNEVEEEDEEEEEEEEELDKEEEKDEAEHDDNSRQGRNVYSQLYCLFQMITYRVHGGKQKPPLHAMVGQAVYGKTRSRELLTTLNRIGVSTSYKEVRDSRNMLKSYAVSGSKDDIPIPSHFTKEGWAMAAFDNSDYKDTSSLSGTCSRHYTASVLYQEAVGDPIYKPLVSSTSISKSDKLCKDMLPCQIVPPHPKPVIRPIIPPDILLAENTNLLIEGQILEALKESKLNEFLITFIRVGLPHSRPTAGQVPPWGGIHALISQRDVPMMRVGFLPVIPRPVTEYCTVRKALQNFKRICQQLSQDVLPVISDEGVFHTVADIIMAEPAEFNDLFPMLGMFHYTKVLLRCAGRYLSGSGAEDALIECEVFGKQVLHSVLSGSHYVRSLQGIMIVSEVLFALQWESFWLKNDSMCEDSVIQTAIRLKESLSKKNKRDSLIQFTALLSESAKLEQQFGDWIKECEEKSELCAYFGVYQKLVSLIKQIITADREGNWPLHVASVQESMPILREFDAINYLRYASWYLERIQVLEVTHPTLFRRFSMGLFTVKDHPGSFNAVAPDLKLEQTIQRISQGPGGHVIVGASGNIPIVAEFELLYHEIGAITNLLQQLTNIGVLNHLETNVQHELSEKKGLIFDKNVARLIDFIKARKNPFDITMKIPLHNFVTGVSVDEVVKTRLLGVIENGTKGYQAFRNERFVLKTSKLSSTISKVNLPHFGALCDTRSLKQNDAPVTLKTGSISCKHLTSAQREVDIIKERGKTMEFILGYDLFDTSPLFDGAWCTKPDKSQLIRELEQNLNSEDYVFSPVSNLKTDIILDFMSKVRQYRNLSSFTDFGQVIQRTLSATKNVCLADRLHIVFDSYCELSVKEGERIRRAADCGGEIDVISLSESVPIPKQIEKFWASSKNKQALQVLARNVILRDFKNIVVSGMVVNEEILQAMTQEDLGSAINVPELSNWQEEADNRLISHIAWSVKRGCERILVLSNDTDSIALILRYLPEFKCRGLCELWIEIGTGEHRRKVPLHTLHEKIGDALCRVIIKAHILTGNDEVSKIGTKHAALLCNPLMLTNFAETNSLSEMDEEIVEKYLVKTWAGHRSKLQADTFNKLRLLLHLEGKDLHCLPPTSSVIRGHIKRSFCVIRNVLMLLNSDNFRLNPENYGWENRSGTLFPIKYLCPIPPELLVKCHCGKKCDNNICKCKLHGVSCVEFCHKNKGLTSMCVNK